MPPRTPRQLRARQATLLRSVSACDCDNCTLCDDRMGLRLTLFRCAALPRSVLKSCRLLLPRASHDWRLVPSMCRRHTLQSVRGLCCGRVESPSAAVASAAAPRAPRLTPRVAIRVGVDAGGAPEEGAAAEGQQQQRREKRAKREKPPPPPRPTHFLALQVTALLGCSSCLSSSGTAWITSSGTPSIAHSCGLPRAPRPAGCRCPSAAPCATPSAPCRRRWRSTRRTCGMPVWTLPART